MTIEDEKKDEQQEPSNDVDSGAADSGNASDTVQLEPAEKTFTQTQVNRMMANEKRQGRAAALKDLGIDPKDETTLKEIRDYIESKKTDTQRETEAKRAIAEANKRAQIAEIKAQAMIAGAKPQYVDDLVTLAIPKMDDESADLQTVIGEFKTKYAIWFGAGREEDESKDAGKSNAGKRGTGAALAGNSGGSSKQQPQGIGARLAAQRRANAKKQSYWS